MPGDKGPRGTWHGREYAPQAEHHRLHDASFIARHPPDTDSVVVDVGCGTGEFTVQLAELVPAGRVIGVDPDPSMLEEAQTKARTNLEFRVGRVQQLDEVCALASADLIVSRAMFHWIPLNEYARQLPRDLARLETRRLAPRRVRRRGQHSRRPRVDERGRNRGRTYAGPRHFSGRRFRPRTPRAGGIPNRRRGSHDGRAAAPFRPGAVRRFPRHTTRIGLCRRCVARASRRVPLRARNAASTNFAGTTGRLTRSSSGSTSSAGDRSRPLTDRSIRVTVGAWSKPTISSSVLARWASRSSTA